MPGTTVEGIFEELKKFLSPESIWQKVLVRQHDLLKSSGAPTTKPKIAQKVFISLLQLYNSFRTPEIEQKKVPKSLTVFFKLCLKMILNNTEIILNCAHFLDDTETALEIQVPFSSSILVLSWCFNIEKTKKSIESYKYIYIYIYIYLRKSNNYSLKSAQHKSIIIL